MDLSIIIVEYMDIGMLERAILSVHSHISNSTTEIIVVSNSLYPPAKQAAIHTRFRGTRCVFNQNNLGFSKAVNQGILLSSRKFIMLLNPDAKILDDSLPSVIDFMEDNPRIGIVGPQVIDRNGEIQDSCRDLMTVKKLVLRTWRRLVRLNSGGIIENKEHSKLQPVDWVSGACMIVRRKAIDSVGLLDERYFMYMEDVDWCRRFWQQGWEVWYHPGCKVEHNASRESTKSFSFTNRQTWIHLASFCKYFLKWHFRM